MDSILADYIKTNKELIQNYFVMKHKSGFLVLFISTKYPFGR